MRAAIYCRVSTEDQSREGTSLESQLEACKKLAKEKGYEVENEYTIREVYSGLTLDRPDLTKLRGWLDAGELGAVVIYSSDRFSRDGYDFLTLIRNCQKANAELLCVTEPIENGQVGELLSYVRGWASKLEAQRIKERTIRGKMARAKSGRLLGGKSTKPYGYNYLPGKGVGEGVRYPNEEEAKWVREMYRWLIEEGLTVNGIVYRLRVLGVPTPSNSGPWSKSTVHKILTNPAYIGRTYAFTQSRVETQRHYKPVRKNKATHIVFKPIDEWIEIPNATPPVISEELFQQAQAQLQRNCQLSPRNKRREYLLSGYLFCQHCGRRYTGSTATIKSKSVIRYRGFYRCPKRARIESPTPCRNRIWRAEYLEGVVWREIEHLLSKPEVILIGLEQRNSEAAKAHSYEMELETVEVKLHNMERQKGRAWKAFELTGDELRFRDEIKDIMESIEELERRKIEIERRVEVSEQAELDIDGIKRFCQLASRNLAEFSFEDKRLALEALNIKVRIDNEHITIEGAIPVADVDIASTTSWRSRQHHPEQWLYQLWHP